MPYALAVTMVSAVALSLIGVGLLGAGIAVWQLLGWLFAGQVPLLAASWRNSGLTGEFLAMFFAWLPALLALAIAFHCFVAWLGTGLLWRRGWARRTALGFAMAWAALAALGCAVARYALEDLARGYPERASFARVAESLVLEVTLVNIVFAAALALLLIQPAVRAQFSAGS